MGQHLQCEFDQPRWHFPCKKPKDNTGKGGAGAWHPVDAIREKLRGNPSGPWSLLRDRGLGGFSPTSAAVLQLMGHAHISTL